MKKYWLFLLILSVFTLSNAQENYITVNGQSISKQEFNNKFAQNIEAEGLDQAINTYVDIELLKQAAQNNKMDTLKVYRKFSGKLKGDLLGSFRQPKAKKDSLLNLFVERTQSHKKVAYFSFPIENYANKNSVNQARTKAEQYKKEICQKGNTKLEQQYFKETRTHSLYVSPLDFPLEIENTIYKTPVGSCSNIEEWNHNFYFVKAIKERPTNTLFTYSHLWVKDKDKIDTIFASIDNEDDYFEAVKKYSEEKITKVNHGLVKRLTASIDDTDFEVLNNMKKRSISKPIKSGEGWHILYLAEKVNCDKNKNCADLYDKKIKEEQWELLLEQDRKNEAAQRVKYSTNKEALKEVMDLVKPDFFTSNQIIGLNSDKDIHTTPYGSFTQQDLIDAFISAKDQLPTNSDVELLKTDIYNDIVNNWKDRIYSLQYLDFNPKIKERMSEIEDQMLVNYYIEKYIYNKAAEDTSGLKKYYEQNLETYTWPIRYQTDLYVCKDKQVQSQVEQFLKQGKSKQFIEDYYKKIPIENNILWLFVQSGDIPKENDILPANTNYNLGVESITDGEKNYVVNIKKILPPSQMTMEEAGDVLLEAYKNQYFLQTLSDLRDKAVITINN